MDKEQARTLLPLVNNLEAVALLNYFLKLRIETLSKTLETAQDSRVITITQGRIAELRYLEQLRDEVREKAK